VVFCPTTTVLAPLKAVAFGLPEVNAEEMSELPIIVDGLIGG